MGLGGCVWGTRMSGLPRSHLTAFHDFCSWHLTRVSFMTANRKLKRNNVLFWIGNWKSCWLHINSHLIILTHFGEVQEIRVAEILKVISWYLNINVWLRTNRKTSTCHEVWKQRHDWQILSDPAASRFCLPLDLSLFFNCSVANSVNK